MSDGLQLCDDVISLGHQELLAEPICPKWYAQHLGSLQCDLQVGKVWERGQGGGITGGGSWEVGPCLSMDPALGQVDVQVPVCFKADNQVVSTGQGLVRGTNDEHNVAVCHSIHPPKAV
eukprot:671324-Rhodomonas_salina.2